MFLRKQHTKRSLVSLKSRRSYVRIQNQTGPQPLRWDKTRTYSRESKSVSLTNTLVYVVWVNGSGRVCARNRKFRKLRHFIHFYAVPSRMTLDIKEILRSHHV